MCKILNCSIETIAPSGKIMFYLGTGAVLLSILYLLVWTSDYLLKNGKEIMWDENYSNSVKKLLPLFIRNGFLMVFTGLIIGIILLLLEWSNALLLMAVVPVLYGLIVFFVAWHIRQGLLYGRIVRLAFELIKMPLTIHWLFMLQFFFWMVMFVCWVNPVIISPVLQITGIAGSALLITILSILPIMKLKKLKND